jgi:hypothetical protein
MLSLVVSLMEVLVHTAAFWTRLKFSEVLKKMVIRLMDSERGPESLLKKKCIALMKAIACEKHSSIPNPVDPHRFR